MVEGMGNKKKTFLENTAGTPTLSLTGEQAKVMSTSAGSSKMELLSSDNPVFAAYAFYASVLVTKVLFMALLTARQRMAKKVFANPEDAKLRGSKVVYNDPDVERVRRAHLNDLENIPAFLFIAFLYIFTEPSTWLALNLFRAYTAARILHTVVYAVVPLPQPSRGLAFGVALFITLYMAFQVATYFCYY